MKRKSSAKEPFSLATNVAALALLAVAVTILVAAFFLPVLPPHRVILVNIFFSLTAGGSGFIWGGVLLTLTFNPSPKTKVAVPAVGGSALFIMALLHPPFSSAIQLPPPPLGQLQIVSPAADSTVADRVQVRGFTSYPDRYHYIIVTGVVAGGDSVQDDVPKPTNAGEFAGLAKLGSVGVGAGEGYMIRVVATRTRLESGPFKQPEDAIFSNAITVRRTTRVEGS